MEAARKAADREQPRKVAKIKPRLYKFMISWNWQTVATSAAPSHLDSGTLILSFNWSNTKETVSLQWQVGSIDRLLRRSNTGIVSFLFSSPCHGIETIFQSWDAQCTHKCCGDQNKQALSIQTRYRSACPPNKRQLALSFVCPCVLGENTKKLLVCCRWKWQLNFRSGANPGIFATGWSSSQVYDASGWKRTCGGERGLSKIPPLSFSLFFWKLIIPTILEQSGSTSTDLSVSFSYKSGSNKRATILNQLLIPLVQTGWKNCTVRGNNKTFRIIFFFLWNISDDLKKWHLTDENWPTNNNIEADTFNNLSNPTSVTPKFA